MPAATADVLTTLNDHITHFVERPHPGFGGQPVCPFSRRARAAGRVYTAVLPYSSADDAAVTWAVETFDAEDRDVLLVVHPHPAGLSYPELSDLRDRFARRLAGRYEVFTGHPDDPYTRAGVRTRVEPFPVLHFVRSARLAEAEAQLGPRRRAMGS